MRVFLDIFTSECAHRHTRMHSRTHAGTLAHVYMIYLYIILPCHTCARKYQYIMYNKGRGLKYSRPFKDIDRFLSIFGEQRKCLEYHTSVRERDRKALGDWLNNLSLEVMFVVIARQIFKDYFLFSRLAGEIKRRVNVCCNSSADFFIILYFFHFRGQKRIVLAFYCLYLCLSKEIFKFMCSFIITDLFR